MTRAALFLLAAAALIAFGVLALQRRFEDVNRIVEAQIGETRFVYTAAFARDEPTAAGGRAERLAFVATFPDFAASYRTKKPGAARPAATRDIVFLTLTPKEDGPDPAERPEKLYARFLEGEAWAGPGGLILRRFEANSPYDLEQLYVAPPGGGAFFARCPKPQPASAAPAEQCLSLFRLGEIDVELRFSAALLDRWETLDEGAREFANRLRAPQRRRAP